MSIVTFPVAIARDAIVDAIDTTAHFPAGHEAETGAAAVS